MLGTPAFLAPELLPATGSFDGRADIYALGCVAFWLLTGRRPFEGSNAETVLTQQPDTLPRAWPSSFTQSLPAGMDHLVLDCLSRDPALRPATVEVFTERLDGLPNDQRWTERRAREWWEQHAPDCIRP